jgi:hypothetical protein
MTMVDSGPMPAVRTGSPSRQARMGHHGGQPAINAYVGLFS